MNKTKTLQLVRMLMTKHGLVGWNFQFMRAKQTLGRCRHSTRTIYLSEPYMLSGTEAEITNTLLHEIAHALVGPGHGHDAVWRRKAISIGSSGDRCSAVANFNPRESAPWTGVCPKGHAAVPLLRAPLRTTACGKCSPRFSKDNLYSWSKNGQPVRPSDMPARFAAEWARLHKA